MKKETLRKIKNFILLTLLVPLSGFSQVLPDISFDANPWAYSSSGVTYDAVTKELTIIGNPSAYRQATLVVNVPFGTDSIFFEAEIWAEHIQKGTQNWWTGKLKINGLLDQTVNNLPEGAEGVWTTDYVGNALKGKTTFTLELSMHNCSGTFKIKNPKLTTNRPSKTPYSFPYTIPANPLCKVDLVSTDKQPFNNDLLSFNNHFQFEKTVNWSTPEVIDAINNYYPMTNYRFPGGTVGNHYNWTTDLVYDDLGSQPTMGWLIGKGRAYGYPGFKNQILASGGTATLMFNVNSDDKTAATSRLQSRVNDGLNVKWIELGNETYYSHQSHGSAAGGAMHVSDVNAYINYTKDLSTALKGVSSTTGIAVPIDHDNYSTGGWSDMLSKETYFDATIIHLYVGTGDAVLTYTGGLNLLNGYSRVRKTIDVYKSSFGSTPTLFTEWLSMGPSGILTILSNGDVFMGLIEGDVQDGIVKQAGQHMFTSSANMDGGIMKHSAYGVTNAKLFEVFKGREIFTALSVSDELVTGLPGIISKAVDFGDSVKVFSINKYPVEAELTVTYDGDTLIGGYVMETYSNSNPSEALITYLNPREAWVNTTGAGIKKLAGYSLTVTTIAKSNIITSSNELKVGKFKVYPNPSSDHLFFDGVKMNENYEMFDASGKLVLNGKVSSAGIDVSVLSTGIYVVKVGTQVTRVSVK